MNHDYAHCIDYNEKCPQSCFRAQLVRDLKESQTVSWMAFKDTKECPFKEKEDEAQ